MNGGLLKSASRLALLAAAGLFVGGVAMPSAKAADLGGDCCADLEERVAELEATTARKGNRKMSLTITGQVNREIVWWDDGHRSKTYYGLDNTASSSRFSLLGEARIAPKVKSGFEIMIEIEAGGTASKVSQFDEDGKLAHTAPLGTNVSFNGPGVDGYFGDARRVAWWLEHADVGRITVGRYEGTGTPYTIDLGGIGAVAPGSKAIGPMVASFFLRDTAGNYYNVVWGNVLDPVGTSGGGLGRVEVLRYDSPSLMGFIASAHIAEAGDYWGIQLRYAGEFSGVRVAAHVGYDNSKDLATPVTIDPTVIVPLQKPDVTAYGAAGSIMHVPSGLFLQGHWYKTSYDVSTGASNAYWGSTSSTAAAPQKDGKDWLIQGGIAKNWTGWGNTALYGEYGKSQDFAAKGGTGRDFAGSTACTTPPFTGNCAAGFTALNGVIGSEVTMWGVGIVQNIDAGAMELYLGYRNYSLDVDLAAGAVNFEDFKSLAAGARIKF